MSSTEAVCVPPLPCLVLTAPPAVSRQTGARHSTDSTTRHRSAALRLERAHKPHAAQIHRDRARLAQLASASEAERASSEREGGGGASRAASVRLARPNQLARPPAHEGQPRCHMRSQAETQSELCAGRGGAREEGASGGRSPGRGRRQVLVAGICAWNCMRTPTMHSLRNTVR